MKTNITIAAISLLIITVLAAGRYASAETTGKDTLTLNSVYSMTAGISVEDEAYINDIPFDTRSIAIESILTGMEPSEEAYVNDIPFDTEVIAASNNLMKIKPEEELYINDIPFNTTEIAKQYSNCCHFASDTE